MPSKDINDKRRARSKKRAGGYRKKMQWHLASLSRVGGMLLFSLLVLSIIIISPFQLAQGTPSPIGNLDQDSTEPRIAVSGLNVYAVWRENDDILFQSSLDGGVTFGSIIPISSNAGTSKEPDIAVVEMTPTPTIYIAWSDNTDTASGSIDIFLAKSADGGLTFDAPITVATTEDDSANPSVAAWNDGTNNEVFVVWQDGDFLSGEIFIANKTDSVEQSGASFNFTTITNTPEADSINPKIAVSENGDLHIVWQESDSGSTTYDIQYTRSTNGGESFADFQNISNSPDISGSADIEVSGSNVYIAWQELGSSFTNDIMYSLSQAGGDLGSFSATSLNLSNSDENNSLFPDIAVAGSNIYIGWQEAIGGSSSSFDIFLVTSTDDGVNIGCPINSSNNGLSSSPSLAADEIVPLEDPLSPPVNTLLAVWQQQDPSTSLNTIYLDNNIDYLQPQITLDPLNPSSVKWGIDEASASGTVANFDVAAGDSITIEWGDGTTSTGITPVGCSWGPITHPGDGTYDAGAISSNPNQVVARLLDVTGAVTKASSTISEVTVLPHSTLVLVNPIPSVIAGADVTITAKLLDADLLSDGNSENDGVSGKSLTLSGTGVTTDLELAASSQSTAADGTFSVTGPTPTTIDNRWSLVAQFLAADGDAYSSSDPSSEQVYNTVDPATAHFVSDETNPLHLDLNFDSGFSTSVDFVEGTVTPPVSAYAQQCTSIPESSRYIALGQMCVEISPDIQMEYGSSALVSMTFAGQTIPAGHAAEEVDIFLETAPGTVVDITTSRNLDSQTIVGNASSFGKFIVGVALHSPREEGVARNQLFLGQNNAIFLRDVDNPSSESVNTIFDKQSYAIGDVATFTVTDKERNVDRNAIDTNLAFVHSTTDPLGIAVVITETGKNTNQFQGSFTLSNETSSPELGTLQVAVGDDITVGYTEAPGMRFKANVSGLLEAGVADVSDFPIPEFSTVFSWVGHGVQIRLVDAQISDNAQFQMTFSYENVYTQFGGIADENLLRVYRGDMLEDGSISWSASPISPIDPDTGYTIGVDPSTRTVTVEASTPAIYALGFEDPGIGGAGGGLGLPGAGVVLDFIAPVAASTSNDGGSTPSSGRRNGGGSTATDASSTINKQLSEGSDVEVTASTSTGDIEITFESIISSTGQLIIKENPDLNDYTDLFDSIYQNQGKIIMVIPTNDGDNRAEYTTVGSIFEINATSGLEYSGKILITIEYDPALILASGGNEQDIRMLHYYDGGATGGLTAGSLIQGDDEGNTAGWEDVTTFIDTQNNTISGYLGSLSPIALAITEDNTFGKAYFEIKPLARILVSNTSWALTTTSSITVSPSEPAKATVQAGQQVSISSSIENIQRNSQQFVYLVQVLDDQDIVHSINWQTGVLTMGQDTDVSVLWTPEESGRYSVKIFVWNSIDRSAIPSPLSTIAVMHIQVSE